MADTETSETIGEPAEPTADQHGDQPAPSPALEPALRGETVVFDRSPAAVAAEAARALEAAEEHTETKE